MEEISFSKMEEAADLVAHYAEHDLEKYETIAVLTRTEEQAQNIDMLLRKRDLEPSYIDRDSSAFQTGITVTTSIWQRDWSSIRSMQSAEWKTAGSSGGLYLCNTCAPRARYGAEQ